MSTTYQPAYGTERTSLVSPKGGGGPFVIERMVFVDEGQTHFYDEASKDFVTWVGSWRRVEQLGEFDSREAARLFMVARSEHRLQLQECVQDVAMAVEDIDADTLEHGYLCRALTCLETAVALMKAGETAA